MKVTSVFIKYLNYACKITWIEFLITLCLVKEFYSNQQTKTFCYVSIHLRSHINNSSSCLTGISKHEKTMYENTSASVFIHCFLVLGYPAETLDLVVHILHNFCPRMCYKRDWMARKTVEHLHCLLSRMVVECALQGSVHTRRMNSAPLIFSPVCSL
jgi:hypothetical protein